MVEINTKSGLETVGSFVHRDKDGNIKGEGEILGRKGSVVRDENGTVIAFTDPAGVRHESTRVNDDSPN